MNRLTPEALDALRTALEKIALDPDLVYMGCPGTPFCGSPHENTAECPVAVAREALGEKS